MSETLAELAEAVLAAFGADAGDVELVLMATDGRLRRWRVVTGGGRNDVDAAIVSADLLLERVREAKQDDS